MGYTTYYFGAGASVQAIPAVGEGFNNRFTKFCDLLKHFNRLKPLKNKENNFIDKIVAELPMHYSIDTFARKLFFQNGAEYNALKVLLSYYFLFEQLGNKVGFYDISNTALLDNLKRLYKDHSQKLDSRYDVVYAALLNEHTKKLPDDLYVISWNYDCQFEASLKEFLGIPYIVNAMQELRVFPSIEVDGATKCEQGKFLKLNGTAGLIRFTNNRGSFDRWCLQSDNLKMEDFELCFADLGGILNGNATNKIESLLHFAWENDPRVNAARKRAVEIIANTDELIITGYSFPVYNRRIDKEILANLARAKVFIQVLDNDFESVKERFLNATRYGTTLEVYQVKDLNQFFIPDKIL